MNTLLSWPDDPFALVPKPAFAPTARRALEFAGGEVELCWMPERAQRSGKPGAGRPPFLASPADRILREETVLERGAIAITPNKFPFSDRHLVLWQKRPIREAERELLDAVVSLAEKVEGTAIVNSIGAAASIPRAHAHVLGERLGFLPRFERATVGSTFGLEPGGARLSRLSGLPIECLAIDGPFADRIALTHGLLQVRMTTAFNLIGEGETLYLIPRSATEIPAPHFPQALGAAEIWGRWCFHDQQAFENATAESLTQAFQIAGYAPGAAG
ncbi:MAG: hypothetical protein AAF196_11075 [Planctomycetota bacterium]